MCSIGLNRLPETDTSIHLGPPPLSVPRSILAMTACCLCEKCPGSSFAVSTIHPSWIRPTGSVRRVVTEGDQIFRSSVTVEVSREKPGGSPERIPTEETSPCFGREGQIDRRRLAYRFILQLFEPRTAALDKQ